MPVEFYQRADIYSFAIIIHEISFRNGTFYLCSEDLEPQGEYNLFSLSFLWSTFNDWSFKKEAVFDKNWRKFLDGSRIKIHLEIKK